MSSDNEKVVPVAVTTTCMGHDGPPVETAQSPVEDVQLKNATTTTWSLKQTYSGESLPTSTGRYPFMGRWVVEIFFCLCSLLSFTTIVAVLGAYNGRSLPTLPLHVTLNTFLAFFTTLCRASFITPITEAFGQWKWNLLTQDGRGRTRTLADFEALDSASRGTWGAWKVLRNFKWTHFVSFAAVFSILSIFTSPITQQMIEYKERPATVEAEASLPFNRVYDRTLDTMADITRATFLGMSSSLTNPVFPLAASCGSSNCTFEPYSTLGVCLKMKDISEMLTVVEIKNSTSADWTGGGNRQSAVLEGNGTTAWNASLPNGIHYTTPLSFAMLLAGNDESLVFAADRDDRDTAFAHMFAIYSNAGNVSYPGRDRSRDEPWEFRAVEILYHACVIDYETEFRLGNSTTRQVAASNAVLGVPGNKPLYNAKCQLTSDLALNYCDFADADAGFTLLKDPHAPDDPSKFYSFSRVASNMLTYNTYFDLSNSFMGDSVPGHPASWMKQNYYALRTAVYGVDYGLRDPQAQLERLEKYFGGMAVAASNMIRASAPNSQALRGTAWVFETYVHINWGWAAFLAVQMALSYAFLAATIYRTRVLGTPVIKSSELATLLASTDEMRRAVGSVEALRDAEERAKTVGVRLEGGRLVLA